jgi:hypothetical protein
MRFCRYSIYVEYTDRGFYNIYNILDIFYLGIEKPSIENCNVPDELLFTLILPTQVDGAATRQWILQRGASQSVAWSCFVLRKNIEERFCF